MAPTALSACCATSTGSVLADAFVAVVSASSACCSGISVIVFGAVGGAGAGVVGLDGCCVVRERARKLGTCLVVSVAFGTEALAGSVISLLRKGIGDGSGAAVAPTPDCRGRPEYAPGR